MSSDNAVYWSDNYKACNDVVLFSQNCVVIITGFIKLKRQDFSCELNKKSPQKGKSRAKEQTNSSSRSDTCLWW